MSKDSQREKMISQPVSTLVLQLAVPTVITQLITVMYNTVDTWFVSQISTSASAAVGIVFSLMALIQAIGYGFGMGAGNLLSKQLGAQKDNDSTNIVASAIIGGIGAGFLIQVFGLIFLDPLMRLLGATPTMLNDACDYATYILIASPLMCGTFVLNLLLRSEGFAKYSMVGLCAGGILNVLLDPLLIITFNLGITGAAIATAISQAASFALLWILFRKKSIVQFQYRRFSFRYIPHILANGVPTICRQSLGSVATALLNNQAALYGDAAVAAMTIVNKIYTLVRNIILGIGQGFQPIAGYNYGAKRYERTKKAFGFTTFLGTSLGLVFAIAILPNIESIIRWFRDDPAVIEIGTKGLLFSCILMPFLAYPTYVNQLHQSIGLKWQATILASCRQGIFFIPLIIIIPAICGLTGIQLAQPSADLFTCILSIPFQLIAFRRVLPSAEPGGR